MQLYYNYKHCTASNANARARRHFFSNATFVKPNAHYQCSFQMLIPNLWNNWLLTNLWNNWLLAFCKQLTPCSLHFTFAIWNNSLHVQLNSKMQITNLWNNWLLAVCFFRLPFETTPCTGSWIPKCKLLICETTGSLHVHLNSKMEGRHTAAWS